MSKTKARVIKSYHYTECGLDNVYLERVVVEEEHAGEVTITLPRIQKLHQSIAKCIIEKADKVNGKEIRFLRTEMGLTHEALAEKLGVSESEIVKWEQGKAKIRNAVDVDLRVLMFSSLVKAKSSVVINLKSDQKKITLQPEKDRSRQQVGFVPSFA